MIGPLGASTIAAATSLRVPFFLTGVMLLLTALWVWRVVPHNIAETARAGAVVPAPLPTASQRAP